MFVEEKLYVLSCCCLLLLKYGVFTVLCELCKFCHFGGNFRNFCNSVKTSHPGNKFKTSNFRKLKKLRILKWFAFLVTVIESYFSTLLRVKIGHQSCKKAILFVERPGSVVLSKSIKLWLFPANRGTPFAWHKWDWQKWLKVLKSNAESNWNTLEHQRNVRKQLLKTG